MQMTDRERELVNMMADMIEKNASDCRKSASDNPGPIDTCFVATSVVLTAMAADLRRKAKYGDSEL